jgi:hypothetical protein
MTTANQKRNQTRATKEQQRTAAWTAQFEEILGGPQGPSPFEIRQARIGLKDEPYEETAARLGVPRFRVHEAMLGVSLTPDERNSIIMGFLEGEHIRDAVSRTGTCATAVLGCIRGALIHARLEAHMRCPTPYDDMSIAERTELFNQWCRERGVMA